MIGLQYYSGIPTKLDINGPILSFIEQPTSVTVCSGVAATFIGVATAIFPEQTPSNPASNSGIITYRWYDQNGPLFDDPPSSGGDGLTISGAGTTTLTLYDNLSVKTLFLRADYIPSAYGLPGVAVTVGTARSTGNASRDPLDSEVVSLNLNPLISITSEPLDATVAESSEATFVTTASSTDGTGVSYQWQLNGENISDTSGTTTNTITPVTAIITVTDNLGGSFNINFGEISSYSNFISGRTYTLVSNTNIETTITASGAGGGSSIERAASGGAGGKSTGNFTFISGQPYQLVIGGAGVNGGAGGFAGGGSGGGGSGRGGGGGGYTGLFINSVSHSNAIIIAGGGGGGSNDPAGGGAGGGDSGGNSGNAGDRGGFGGTSSTGGAGGSGGSPGSALQGGPGSAGGGGGYYGGGGGTPFNGCCADGAGGGGSGYVNTSLVTNASTTSGAGSAPSSEGTFKIDVVSAQVTAITTISGSRTPTLKISSNVIGLNQVNCIISHPTACNSPVVSRIANFSVVSARQIINYEEHLDSSTSIIRSGSVNVFNNSLSFFGELAYNRRTIVFYPSERNVKIRMTLAGSAGLSNGNNRGGYGGVTVFEYTLLRNVEYVLKLGVSELYGTSGNIGGGFGAYFYEKGRILVCSGGGGGAGASARGGDGGGAGVAGENGSGIYGGSGGIGFANGTLPTVGFFPGGGSVIDSTSTTAGRLSGCTVGGNYFSSRYAPCDDIGTARFRNSSGTEIPGTSLILRGFKPGTAHRNNGGNGSGSNGGGGDGTYGGNAAIGSGSGGGGASGYSDGSTTIISATLGGNTSTTGYAIIQLA